MRYCAPSPMALEPGHRLGPYVIQALLGTGGMGEVYQGRDTRLGRDVALKVISPKCAPDPSFRRRFETEARAASALNHPGIVTVYDVGDTEGVPWIAMEWVEGRTLRQVIDAGTLSIPEVVRIARQIADGLAAAHGKGVVHRDLKPGNVMLTADGRGKILDFGLARQTPGVLNDPSSRSDTADLPPRDATREGAILGTVGYMSPEQAAGRPVDFRSDQFSFGLIVYEMLAGQRAFERPTPVETLAAVIRDEPVSLSSLRPGIPEPLHRLVATCLAKLPQDRFASTREMVAALDALATGSTGAAEIPTATHIVLPPPPPSRPSRMRLALLLGVPLGLAVAAAGWRYFQPTRGAIDSLAVLPFENASKDPDAEYLGDGLTESLIDQMSRVPSLKVMARSTVFRFKGTSDPQEAGRKLGVGAILTGTVSRRADHLVVSAELMETATGVRLWGEKYDRPFGDLLRVQDSIASDITDKLRLRLSVEEKRALSQHGTADPQAYELFLKAGFFFAQDTEEGDLEARRLYQQAAQKDPKYVEAHLGVAITYSRSAVNGYAPPAEAWPRMDEEVKKAVGLDPQNVLARAVHANQGFFYDWDWARSEREFRELSRDIQGLLVDHFRPVYPIALFFWARGRTEETVTLMEKVLRHDPGNLESRVMMGDFLAQAGRLEQAAAFYRATAEAEPTAPGPWIGLAEVLRRRGDVKNAIDALRKGYELSGEEHGKEALAAARTEADYEAAQIAVARFRLADLESLAKERYVSPLDLARLYAQVGEREKAFTSLEAAVAERSPGLVFLKADQAWDRIRGDVRFAAFVRRVGIP